MLNFKAASHHHRHSHCQEVKLSVHPTHIGVIGHPGPCQKDVQDVKGKSVHRDVQDFQAPKAAGGSLSRIMARTPQS